jgi:hypothetical protein
VPTRAMFGRFKAVRHWGVGVGMSGVFGSSFAVSGPTRRSASRSDKWMRTYARQIVAADFGAAISPVYQSPVASQVPVVGGFT